MIDGRYRWETPIWLHSLAALTKSSKTNWEIFNVNIAMPFLFLVAEFEMTVLQIPFLFWWRSLAAFLVSSLASLSSQCGTSSSASRSLFTRSVPSRKVFYKNYHPGIFCIQIWEIIPYLYREEVRHRRLSSLPSILSTNWYTLLKSASLSSKSEY